MLDRGDNGFAVPRLFRKDKKDKKIKMEKKLERIVCLDSVCGI